MGPKADRKHWACLADLDLCITLSRLLVGVWAVGGNRYSVSVAHVGAPVTVRLHAHRVRVWRDTECIADHPS